MVAIPISWLIRAMERVDDANAVLLPLVDNHDTRESMLMDLFSQLFLKQGGPFLCDKLVAQRNAQVTRPLSDT